MLAHQSVLAHLGVPMPSQVLCIAFLGAMRVGGGGECTVVMKVPLPYFPAVVPYSNAIIPELGLTTPRKAQHVYLFIYVALP